MRLLIIEDDVALCDALKLHLAKEGYTLDICANGADAAYYLSAGAYGVILLDRMLPETDGLTILRNMRQAGITTPVLMLTALGNISDRTDGLDAGADDYLVKPFAMPELLSRVRALLRRPAALSQPGVYRYADLELDSQQCILRRDGEEFSLSKKEAAVFEFFFENPEKVLSRAQILARVWGNDELVEEGNVDNYIYFVRRRLKAAVAGVNIKTVHGVGYMLLKE